MRVNLKVCGCRLGLQGPLWVAYLCLCVNSAKHPIKGNRKGFSRYQVFTWPWLGILLANL